MTSPHELRALLRNANLTEFGTRDYALSAMSAARMDLERRGDNTGAKLLDATASLVKLIPALDPSGARVVQEVVARLCGVVVGDNGSSGAGGSISADDIPSLTGSAYSQLERTENRVLGELLVDMGEATSEVLGAAEARVAETGEKFGEALVRNGALGDETVGGALHLQRHMLETSGAEAKEKGLAEEWRLGDVLIRRHIIDATTLERALKMQRACGMRLGETLVQIGAANWHQISEAVLIQKRERERIEERKELDQRRPNPGQWTVRFDD